jgi:lipoprotein-releasing system permease protein
MIFSPFERMVAMRYLRPRRQEGFVSVIAGFSFLGIMIGVATLIIVMSVMNGFRVELMGRILGLNGHIAVQGAAGPLRDFDPVAEAVRGIPGVVVATPIVEGQVMATAGGRASGALVRGIRRDDLLKKPTIADNIVMGSLDHFEGRDAMILGDALARRLGVAVGQSVTLISPDGYQTVMGSVPRSKTFTVEAVFKIGMYEYDNSFIYIPLESAQVYFRLPDEVSSIEVMVEDADRVAAINRAIREAVSGRPLRLFSWQESNSSFFSALEVERNVMFMILTLIIVVAAFNIIAGMIMLVKDKGRDIAILRTMGATRASIMRVFFLSGASIGVVGTLAGLLLGLVFCAEIETIRQWLQTLTGTKLFPDEIYFLAQMPAEVEPMEVVKVTAMAFGLSFLATLYPSWRAARLDPVEALRNE